MNQQMCIRFLKPILRIAVCASFLMVAPFAFQQVHAQETGSVPSNGNSSAQTDTAQSAGSEKIEQTIAPATILGDFRAWSAYTAQEDGLICFARSKPNKRGANSLNADPAYIYVTHRPALSRRNIVSIVPGFEFQTNSEATLAIGGQVFELVTRNNAAWLKDMNLSDPLIAAMRKGVTMVMNATNVDGEKITDTYSLSGATKATNSINVACQ